MALATANISRCRGLPYFHPSATRKTALRDLQQGRRSMLRPVTRPTVRLAVARSTETPLCGSRKACRLFSCKLPLPVQANHSFPTARVLAYTRQSDRSVRGLNRLGCTCLFNCILLGTVQQHWPSISSLLSRASHRAFSTSYPTMAATRLDGTAIAKKIRERLAVEIVEKQKTNPKYQPCLKIIQGWCFLVILSHLIVILILLVFSW